MAPAWLHSLARHARFSRAQRPGVPVAPARLHSLARHARFSRAQRPGVPVAHAWLVSLARRVRVFPRAQRPGGHAANEWPGSLDRSPVVLESPGRGIREAPWRPRGSVSLPERASHHALVSLSGLLGAGGQLAPVCLDTRRSVVVCQYGQHFVFIFFVSTTLKGREFDLEKIFLVFSTTRTVYANICSFFYGLLSTF